MEGLKTENIIGIDIGGTRLAVLVLKKGKVIESKIITTPKGKEAVIKKLQRVVEECILDFGKSEIKGIGIAVPGPIDFKREIILIPPNIPELRNLALAKILEKKSGIKTRMDNDANCFTLAEAVFGAGRGVKNLVGVTLGTGVGGGIVLDGKIYHGAHGAAGEIGHITVVENGRKCGCGSRGCLEQYASSQYMKWRTGGLSPREIAPRARGGEKKFIKIYEEMGHYLGIGLVDIVNVWDPEMIVIGGGLIHGWRWIYPVVKKEIERVHSPLSRKAIKIRKAKLGGDLAGAIGAALLFQT